MSYLFNLYYSHLFIYLCLPLVRYWSSLIIYIYLQLRTDPRYLSIIVFSYALALIIYLYNYMV